MEREGFSRAIRRRACDCLGDREICRRRDLDVGGLAVHEPDGKAGTFDERRFIARVETITLGDLERLPEHIAPERLRRLGEKNRGAIKRLGDGPAEAGHRRARYVASGSSGTLIRTRPLDRVAGLHRRQRGTGFRRGGDGVGDQLRAGEWPRGIMNHDDVGVRFGHAERIGHRILTPAAARDHPQRLPGTAEREGSGRAKIGWRTVYERLRQRDNKCVDRGVREQGHHAALENRPPAHRNQHLRLRAAEPLATSAGRDDRCDVHRVNVDYMGPGGWGLVLGPFPGPRSQWCRARRKRRLAQR